MNKILRGLCRLGDRAYYDGKKWRIDKLGLTNEHGYPLDVGLRQENGETKKVSAHDEELLIFPSTREVPHALARYAKMEGLEVIRHPSNGDDVVYELRCPECEERAWLSLTTYEAASLRYSHGSFDNSRPEMTDSEIELHCQCAGGSHPLPEGFEVYGVEAEARPTGVPRWGA